MLGEEIMYGYLYMGVGLKKITYGVIPILLIAC